MEDELNDRDPTTARPGNRRRALVIGAVAIGAVVVGVSLSALLLSRPRADVAGASASAAPSASPRMSAPLTPSARATESAAPSAAPVPTSTPLPSGAAPLTWADGTAPDGDIARVAWIGDRWLAVGSSDLRAAAWTSDDGLDWRPSDPMPPDPIPMTPEGDPGTGYWVRDVIAYGGELVAFGWNRIGCCDGGGPMVWRSTDGIAWSPVDTEGSAFDTYQSPSAAAIAPDGALVIVSGVNLGSSTVVFVTFDLRTWEQHTVIDAEPFAQMTAVASSTSLMLAVGSTGENAAGWASPDGRSWTPLDLPAPASIVSSVAWDPGRERFLVAGEDDRGRPAIWLTPDGTSWTTITLADEAGRVEHVDAVAGLIVASGGVGPLDDRRVLAWTSRDGITWQIADLGPSSGFSSAAAGPDGVVVVMNGNSGEPDYEPIIRFWHGAQ